MITSRNHYFPQFLIRNWIDENSTQKGVFKNYIRAKYENGKLRKCVATKQILFLNEIYDDATEAETSKDDSQLANLIRNIQYNSESNKSVFFNNTFLRLVFKLFARQPKLNFSLIDATKDAILNVPYFIGAKNSEILNTESFVRFVNHIFLNSQKDISCDYSKCEYGFGINRTKIPFILPDNTKKLILPLTPNLIVRISSYSENQAKVNIMDIKDEGIIESLNTTLIQNSDNYYITSI